MSWEDYDLSYIRNTESEPAKIRKFIRVKGKFIESIINQK